MKKPYTKIFRYAKPSKGVKQYVRKAINRTFARRVENKYHDIFGTLNVIAGTYNIQLLNGLNQNAGDFARVGNEVCNELLHMKLAITFPDTTNRVRTLIIWDKQPNHSLPIIADLFTYTATPVDSFLNPDSKARFQVLYDKLHTGGNSGEAIRSINKTIKLRNKRTLYNGTTDTIASLNTNALYLITVSDSGLAPNPDVNYMTRLIYSDA